MAALPRYLKTDDVYSRDDLAQFFEDHLQKLYNEKVFVSAIDMNHRFMPESAKSDFQSGDLAYVVMQGKYDHDFKKSIATMDHHVLLIITKRRNHDVQVVLYARVDNYDENGIQYKAADGAVVGSIGEMAKLLARVSEYSKLRKNIDVTSGAEFTSTRYASLMNHVLNMDGRQFSIELQSLFEETS